MANPFEGLATPVGSSSGANPFEGLAVPVRDSAIAKPSGDTITKPSSGAHAASLLDIPLGVPAFIGKMGVRGAVAAGAALTGDPTPLQTSGRVVEDAMQAPWMRLLSQPLQTIFGTQQEGTAGEAIGKALSGPVETAAEYWTEQTGNPEIGEAVRQGFDVVMAKGVEYAIRGGKALKGRLGKGAAPKGGEPPSGAAPEGDVLSEIKAEAAPPPDVRPVATIKSSLDALRNAEQTAYDLMQRGASLREVERVVKGNPKVGEAMERIRQQRADAAAAFDRDFGARQGVVLPPEAARQLGTVESPGAESPAELPRPPALLGSADPKLRAGLAAAGGLAAWILADPDRARERLTEGGIIAAGVILPGMAVGSALRTSKYTLKTLERIPPGWVDVPKKFLEDQLKRQDVSGAERDLLTGILREMPGDSVKASELVARFRASTGDHELTVTGTRRYADSGIENIARLTPGKYPKLLGQEPSTEVNSATSLWRLPFEVSDANHFEDPRLFGWTRSFREKGVEHVVELQSDLAQHTKALTDSQRANVQHLLAEESARLDRLNRELAIAERGEAASSRHPSVIKAELEQTALVQQELQARLKAGEATQAVQPLLKHWPRRLIRETLHQAAAENREVVRFASADTVAKVEGWPEQSAPQRIATLRQTIQLLERDIQTGDTTRVPTAEAARRTIAALQEEIARVQRDGAPRFRPEFQSIYDRYAKDITPFLKRLGGKDYTDPQGHTWIGVPTKPFRGRVEIYGKADLRLLAAIAGAGIGWGMSDENKMRGMLLGGLAGLFVVRVAEETAGRPRVKPPEDAVGKSAFEAFQAGKPLKEAAAKVFAEQGEEAAKRFIEVYQGLKEGKQSVKSYEQLIRRRINDVVAENRLIHNFAKSLEKALPRSQDRVAVAEALDKGAIKELPPALQPAARRLQARFAEIGNLAVSSGVLEGLRENYITHVVDWSKARQTPKQAFIDAVLGKLRGQEAVGSRFSKARKHATFEDLQQALKDSGLALRTQSAPEIYSIYAQSMMRAIANKQLVTGLKALKDSQGKPYVHKITESSPIPRGWSTLDNAAFRGYAIHPELAPHLKFVFEAGDLPTAVQVAYGLSQAVKRVNVIGSFFHAKSLIEASWSAIGPLRTIKDVGLAPVDKLLGTKMSGITRALKTFREGGLGDKADLLLREGLVLEVPEDVQLGIMGKGGQLVDQLISRFGPTTHIGEKLMSGVEKATLRVFDKITWDYLHTGLKLNTAMHLLERARLAHPEIAEATHAKEVSSFVNNAFGGRNWYQAALDAQTEFGKQVALASYGKGGRAAMQMLLFAPDWTTSTVSAFKQVFGESTGLKGLIAPRKAADFARIYQLRTALTYATLIDLINMQTSGHHLWENQDPTRIEFRDGTSMQPMKHAGEPAHWTLDPLKTLKNKLGFIPKALGELAPPFQPGMQEKSAGEKAKAIAGLASPFQVQAYASAPKGEGLERAALGTLGFPVYGKPRTPEKQAELRRQRERRERRRKLKEQSE